MADTSATLQRPEAAPSPEAVEATFDLLRRGVITKTQGRCLRAAEYFERVAADARALWGGKGELCFVLAKLQESDRLIAHACTTTAAEDAAPTWLEAQGLVAECRRILNARLDANTCLVGRCFAVEEDFYARYTVIMLEAGRGAALSSDGIALCRSFKREVGYETCMNAAFQGLRCAYPAAAFRFFLASKFLR